MHTLNNVMLSPEKTHCASWLQRSPTHTGVLSAAVQHILSKSFFEW